MAAAVQVNDACRALGVKFIMAQECSVFGAGLHAPPGTRCPETA